MFERFAQRARDTVRTAVAEAGRRGDRRVGTEHLLIGVLGDPALAELVGADAEAARRVADQLDQAALAAIGFDAAPLGPLEPAVGTARLPFTPGAKAVLARALALVTATRSRRIESRLLLAALLERPAPDPAAEILAALGVDRADVRGRLIPDS